MRESSWYDRRCVCKRTVFACSVPAHGDPAKPVHHQFVLMC
jgi:hypothetical protein